MKEKHGLSGTRIYRIWSNMKRRCLNPKAENYNRYGGRGITVCDEWKNDFMSFYNWSMENGYQEYLTIDRIDNDGNYEPSNCRWATTKDQENNRGDFNIIVTYKGKTQTLMQWAEETKLPFATLRYRIVESKWPVEDAFTIGIGEITRNPNGSPSLKDAEEKEKYHKRRKEWYHKNSEKILKDKERQRRKNGIKSMEEYNTERRVKKYSKAQIIKQTMKDNPTCSVRKLSKLTGIPRTTIQRIVKETQ